VVQSKIKPNWSTLPENYCQQANNKTGILIKNVNSLYEKLKPKMKLRFRLRANPTKKVSIADPNKSNNSKKSKKRSNRKNGYRVPLKRRENQLIWIQRKSSLHGFKILSSGFNLDIPLVKISNQGDYTGKKGNGRVITHFSVLFEGVLKIEDLEKFKKTLKNGIGSGKAFGFGLLSIARA
ncbi:MAG: type I-E CRISPR-associated protein Cas6/Cse3/CasE, partial [Candidatus Lokiarchaeota archaeon]|nr:type I-E CRISPR-associated protein Cas6/Cse3/CasE [Candidatus Lokiarchaeota archaeon]